VVKRNISAELAEGFDALKSEREGQLTVQPVQVDAKPVPEPEPSLSEFDEQMQIGRQIMDEHRDVLRELAK
jgi:hypothetical protein